MLDSPFRFHECFFTGDTPLPNTPPISSSPTLQSIFTPITTVNTNAMVNYTTHILIHKPQTDRGGQWERGELPKRINEKEQKYLSFDIPHQPNT